MIPVASSRQKIIKIYNLASVLHWINLERRRKEFGYRIFNSWKQEMKSNSTFPSRRDLLAKDSNDSKKTLLLLPLDASLDQKLEIIWIKIAQYESTNAFVIGLTLVLRAMFCVH